MESCVHGYYTDQSVWTPTLDDECICVTDPLNSMQSLLKMVILLSDTYQKRYQDSVLYSYGEEEALRLPSIEGGVIHLILTKAD